MYRAEDGAWTRHPGAGGGGAGAAPPDAVPRGSGRGRYVADERLPIGSRGPALNSWLELTAVMPDGTRVPSLKPARPAGTT
jgi:hypothetical protein